MCVGGSPGLVTQRLKDPRVFQLSTILPLHVSNHPIWWKSQASETDSKMSSKKKKSDVLIQASLLWTRKTLSILHTPTISTSLQVSQPRTGTRGHVYANHWQEDWSHQTWLPQRSRVCPASSDMTQRKNVGLQCAILCCICVSMLL